MVSEPWPPAASESSPAPTAGPSPVFAPEPPPRGEAELPARPKRPRTRCSISKECWEDARCSGTYGRCVLASDDDCRLSIPCRVAGRCKFDRVEARCVATPTACRASQDCEEKGRCDFDPEGRRCDSGRWRDKPVLAGGLVVMGLGAASILGGLFLLCRYGVNKSWGQGNEVDLGLGGILLGAGAGVALFIGTPIVIAGTNRVPRAAALRVGVAF